MSNDTEPTPAAEVQGQTILARYEQLYGAGEMSLSRNYADKFPLLEHLLKAQVAGRRVLDFGCGPGRLSLMLGRYAREVHGVDFAEAGIALGELLTRATRSDNVQFFVGDLDFVGQADHRYDVIVVAGTLEHMIDPLETLQALARGLEPGGLLVVQTPSFSNFRGDTYNTLGLLLGLPMSLTDVRQVRHDDVANWADALGLRLEKVVGGHYDLGFLERVEEDLQQRVRAAARDRGVGEDWDFDAYFDWMRRRAEDNRLMVEYLKGAGMLRAVPPAAPLTAERPDDIPDELWEEMHRYLTYSGWREPYYCEVRPFSYYGASAVYFLRAPAS
jgi:2-polyprenyl-3-methyl-5-hydroxy-6-metoxy-1,4-benzoquinol methylase